MDSVLAEYDLTGGETLDRFADIASNLGTKIETRPCCTPQGNSFAERGYGTVIGMATGMTMRGPHLPQSCGEKSVMRPLTF